VKFYAERMSRFPEEIQAVFDMDPAARNPYQWQMYLKARPQVTFTEAEIAAKLRGEEKKRYAELRDKLSEFDSIKPADPAMAQVMVDASASAPKTFMLRGGAWDAPQDEVEPGFLTLLDPKPAVITKPEGLNSTGRRTALANWIASPNNPFTARVAVNRAWHHHFRRGIVGTPGDLGLMGDRPSHPELLDWLAFRFMEDGWSLKKLHKRIVTSHAYRQSSAPNETASAADPDNKLLWRFNRRRLEGETIRDAALATAGLLNTKMGGPGVFPPRPAGTANRNAWGVEQDPGEANRRSIYVFVRRNARYPLFESFDMPDTHESCSRRQQTVSVTQSLAMLNNELVLDWAKSMATRVRNDAGMSADSQIERAFRLAFGRSPSAAEMESSRTFIAKQTALAGGPDAAFVDLCHVLLNSNEFLYVD
jgi:hypothetical protein